MTHSPVDLYSERSLSYMPSGSSTLMKLLLSDNRIDDKKELHSLRIWDIIPAFVFFILGISLFCPLKYPSGLWNYANILFISQLFLIGLLFIIRRPAKVVSINLIDIVIPLGMTFIPLLIHPLLVESLFLPGLLLQVSGFVISLMALSALGDSMAILVAKREIRTTGPYSIVRHPVYLGYFISNIGYICNNLTAYNIGVISLLILFMIIRISREERFLKDDPIYAAYMQKVTQKLLPGIW